MGVWADKFCISLGDVPFFSLFLEGNVIFVCQAVLFCFVMSHWRAVKHENSTELDR